MMTPEEHLSKTIGISIKRWGAIENLRNIAKIGIDYAEPILHKRTKTFIDIFLSSKDLRDYLIVDGINPDEFAKGLPEKITKNNKRIFELSIRASSLIFAQSILDNSTFEYCKITYNFNSEFWLNKIENKKISISDLQNKSKKEIISKKILDYFNYLERQSLITKIDNIFSVCSPDKNFNPIKDYKKDYVYNRDRILEIDKKRHDIIHSNKNLEEIDISYDDIYYFQFTDLYLWVLMMKTFGITVDKYKMF